MQAIKSLNARFGVAEKIAFREGGGGLPLVAIANGRGTCEISLYGGHVLSYRPVGHLPVLFVSKESRFEPGHPIRGGVPVCWPWFGAHPDDTAKPMHGFARISSWRVLATEYSSQETEVRLGLEASRATMELWPHEFMLELRVTLGDDLRLQLATINTGKTAFTFTEALHSYFMVRQIMDITVRGLEGTDYLDKVGGTWQRVKQEGAVIVRQEVDRVYADTEATCTIDDAALRRRIVVTKEGSHSTVVWNPWIEKARRMVDFGDDEYTRMICVETANATTNPVTLEAGATHVMAVSLAVEAYQ